MNIFFYFIIISTAVISSIISSWISKNPVSAIIALISVFIISSIYLFSITCVFISLTYLIIYVGAIAILFLFVVMMINVKYIQLSSHISFTSHLPLAAFIISTLAYELSPIFFDISLKITEESTQLFNSEELPLGSSGAELPNILFSSGYILWDTFLSTFDIIQAIGHNLYAINSIWLIIISIILMLAMIGPIILTHQH